MHMPAADLILTNAQIASFHRDGFIAIPAVTSAEEVASLCEVYDRLFEQRAGRGKGDHLDLSGHDEDDAVHTLPQILNPSKYAPELAVTKLRANAEAIARQLLGQEARFQFEHAIRKPAHIGAATPWHQDEAYSDPAWEYNQISIWVPLQEATLENGCMQFVPGSHRDDVVAHQPIGADPRVTGLEVTTPAAVGPVVACPLPAGGATIHHCRTLHYTGANHSDGPRRAYILAFGVVPTKMEAQRDFEWLRVQKTAWQQRAAEATESTKQENH